MGKSNELLQQYWSDKIYMYFQKYSDTSNSRWGV